MTTKKKTGAKSKVSKRDLVIAFLKRSRSKELTYGQVAEAVDSVAMAVGQIIKSIGNDPGMKALTKRVKNQKDLKFKKVS